MSKVKEILKNFSTLAKSFQISNIEIVSQKEGVFESLVDFPYEEKLKPVTFEELYKNSLIKEKLKNTVFSTEIAGKDNTKLSCLFYPLVLSEESQSYLVIQSKEDIKEKALNIIKFLSDTVLLINSEEETSAKSAPPVQDDKYKIELNNMRNMQAKLFPKFNDVKNMDIATTFLPAGLMSGNFFDGFPITDDLFIISACDVSSCGSSAPFAGATVRALIRSEAVKPIMPSSLIELLRRKINKILPGIEANINLTIYLLNLKNGNVRVSSLGPITTLFYNHNKKGSIDLKDTSVGKIFNDRVISKDISINLEPGDILLYYSKNIVKTLSSNQKAPYSINSLKASLKGDISTSSLIVVHSIINDFYEYTDYEQFENDVMLINIKKI